jgi:hypothetical protein
MASLGSRRRWCSVVSSADRHGRRGRRSSRDSGDLARAEAQAFGWRSPGGSHAGAGGAASADTALQDGGPGGVPGARCSHMGPGRPGGARRRSHAAAPEALHPWTPGTGPAPSGSEQVQQTDRHELPSCPIPQAALNRRSQAKHRVLKRYKASERAEWVSLAGNRWPHLAAVKVGLGMAGISGQDDGIGERCHLVSGVAYLDPDEC